MLESDRRWPRSLRRGLQLFGGLVLYGVAIGVMLRAGIGVPPWDVLAQGIAAQSGIPFGLVVNGLGALVLLLWIPLRQRPGWGTLANVALIGPSAELGLAIVPPQSVLALQVLVFALGLLLLAVATGLYVGAGLGPGPRDGLMTGLHTRLGLPIWVARTGVEVTVVVIGAVLGGPVGVGTLAFALLIGPMVGVTLPLLRVPRALDGPRVDRPREPSDAGATPGSATQALP